MLSQSTLRVLQCLVDTTRIKSRTYQTFCFVESSLPHATGTLEDSTSKITISLAEAGCKYCKGCVDTCRAVDEPGLCFEGTRGFFPIKCCPVDLLSGCIGIEFNNGTLGTLVLIPAWAYVGCTRKSYSYTSLNILVICAIQSVNGVLDLSKTTLPALLLFQSIFCRAARD